MDGRLSQQFYSESNSAETVKFWAYNKWGPVWVSLQEIPARACQLYFGHFKEKPFPSDATAVIRTEVASSNKVS